MSASAIEAKLLRYDLLMSGLDPYIIDLVAPPPSFTKNKEPFAFKFRDSIVEEG